MQIWLPLTDRKNEDVWKDYNGTKIQNYTVPWLGEGPDGGANENCARLVDKKVGGTTGVIFLNMSAFALTNRVST